MKILAIDYGTKNVGIAISDDTCKMAFPLETVASKNSIERIVEIIQEKKITQLIVGLPVNMDGSLGKKARESHEFGKKLERTTGIIPEYIDETLTTFDAEHEMKEHHVKRKKRKELVDQLAAQRMLQEFLDSRNSKR
jgi:putative pre-16S rRNA nuclease